MNIKKQILIDKLKEELLKLPLSVQELDIQQVILEHFDITDSKFNKLRRSPVNNHICLIMGFNGSPENIGKIHRALKACGVQLKEHRMKQMIYTNLLFKDPILQAQALLLYNNRAQLKWRIAKDNQKQRSKKDGNKN